MIFFRFAIGLGILALVGHPFEISAAAQKTYRATYTPRPEYPVVARREKLQGDGLYRLTIDKTTGVVAKVDVVHSTGHAILDQTAINAFRKWRFEPGDFSEVKIPLSFSLSRGDFGDASGVDRKSYESQTFALEDEATKTSVYPLVHPEPEYPLWARERLVTGTGEFRLVVDFASGAVTKVVRLQSTGSEKLDAAGMRALQRWRFAPRVTTSVRVPLTFTIDWGPFSKELNAARKFALYSPTPTFPTAARFMDLQSWGTYQFIIDYETGLVTDVKIIRTSGSGILDKPIVRTFRTWRFRPHTVRTVTTNFGFMFGRGGSGNAG